MSENQGGWSWNLTLEPGPVCLLVRFYGHIAPQRGDLPLAEYLWNIMRRQGTERVVLDFSGVERLSGYVVRQLIALGAQIREYDGMMRICGISEYDQRMLRCYLCDHTPAYGDSANGWPGSDDLPKQYPGLFT